MEQINVGVDRRTSGVIYTPRGGGERRAPPVLIAKPVLAHAAQAGLKAGLRLHAVNGTVVGSCEQAVQLMSAAPEGKEVKLRLYRRPPPGTPANKMKMYRTPIEVSMLGEGGEPSGLWSSALGITLEGGAHLEVTVEPDALRDGKLVARSVDDAAIALRDALVTGDVLAAVNGKVCTKPKAAIKALNEATGDVVLSLVTQSDTYDSPLEFVAISVSKPAKTQRLGITLRDSLKDEEDDPDDAPDDEAMAAAAKTIAPVAAIAAGAAVVTTVVSNKKGCCDDCGLDDCMPEGGVKMVGDVEETGSLGGDLYCIFCSRAGRSASAAAAATAAAATAATRVPTGVTATATTEHAWA